MFIKMIESFTHLITSQIASIGYPMIFALMTLESALIPLPSEITMPFAGFLVGQRLLDFKLVVFLGALGNLLGSLLAYWLGIWGQKKYVRKIVANYGKYLLITVDEVDLAEKWFYRHGEIIAFFSRLLPVIRTFISLPAGFAQMDVLKFSVFTFFGSLIWTTFLTYLGVILGENWSILGAYFHKFDFLIVAGGLLLVALYLGYKIKKINTS